MQLIDLKCLPVEIFLVGFHAVARLEHIRGDDRALALGPSLAFWHVDAGVSHLAVQLECKQVEHSNRNKIKVT
jgi:hypothetical protein